MNTRINRRDMLRAIPTTIVGGVGSQAFTGTALGDSGCQYTLEQGELSEEITPLSNGDSIEDFYGTQTSSLERNGVSVIFLWDGPQGTSLVVINDKSGFSFFKIPVAVTFEFDGLPTKDGRWVVTDDRADFDNPETDTTIDWSWFTGNNDGGAFRGGLDSGFEITVDVERTFGIADIHILSGDLADPERIPLDIGSEFTIKGGCSVEVEIDIKPSEDPDDPNPINTNRRGGYIPVAILNDDDFDPSRVDFDSLRFGAPEVVANGGGATPAHSGRLEDTDGDGDLDPISHWEDVDDDGDLDLVVHFPAEDTGFDSDESQGRIEGKTKDGTPLFGTDSVTFVGSDKGGGKEGRKGGRGSGRGGGKGGGRSGRGRR